MLKRTNYIDNFKSKTAILKLSGKSISEFISGDKWTGYIKKLHENFDAVIIVHGAGKMITQWAEKLGHESVFVEGHRVTTKEMMSVVAAVQGGLINSQLTAKLNSEAIESVGVSGIDRNTFTAHYLDKKIGFVGKPEVTGSINWIKELFTKKVIPVFSSICADTEGNLMNVNADLFTEVLAASLEADTVFFVSDVDGVIIDNQVQEFLTPKDINAGIKSGAISGGMIPKLKSCSELLGHGIKKIWIGSDLAGYLNQSCLSHGTCVVKSYKKENNQLKVA